jgi:hypothetical protein
VENPEQALAQSVLLRATRQAEARQVLSTLPSVGVRVWAMPLAYLRGIIPAIAFYWSGTPLATCLAVAVGMTGASLAVAASAQTRRIAKRLAAVVTLFTVYQNAA